jgi:hypothetical protein
VGRVGIRFAILRLTELSILPYTYINGKGKLRADLRKSANVCYLSVQHLLSSSLLTKNTKIKTYKTIILPVVCMSVKLGRSH